MYGVATPIVLWAGSPDMGIVELELSSPDPGRADPRQVHSKAAKGETTPRLRHVLKVWEDRRRSIPFSEMTTTNLWWVESSDWTHILMDARTRKLIGVQAFDPEVTGQVWDRIKTGFEDPSHFGRPAGAEGEQHPAFDAILAELGGRELYACLHPCPSKKGEVPPLWCWDGINAIRIDHAGGQFELAYELACEQEQILGLADC